MNIYSCPACCVRFTDHEAELYEGQCPNPECECDSDVGTELEAA